MRKETFAPVSCSTNRGPIAVPPRLQHPMRSVPFFKTEKNYYGRTSVSLDGEYRPIPAPELNPTATRQIFFARAPVIGIKGKFRFTTPETWPRSTPDTPGRSHCAGWALRPGAGSVIRRPWPVPDISDRNADTDRE